MKKSPKKSRSTTRAGREILAALHDLDQTLASGVPLGQKYTVREVLAPDPPGDYDARAVKATRESLHISQHLFAALLGVSLVLAQKWEQGKRIPNATARRLLDEINHQPKRWTAMLRPARAA